MEGSRSRKLLNMAMVQKKLLGTAGFGKHVFLTMVCFLGYLFLTQSHMFMPLIFCILSYNYIAYGFIPLNLCHKGFQQGSNKLFAKCFAST